MHFSLRVVEIRNPVYSFYLLFERAIEADEEVFWVSEGEIKESNNQDRYKK